VVLASLLAALTAQLWWAVRARPRPFATALLFALFSLGGVALQRAPEMLLWSVASVGSACACALLTHRYRTLLGAELLHAVLSFTLVAGLALTLFGDVDLAARGVRNLFLAPAVLLLAGYLGGSVGHVLAHGFNPLGYEVMVARRYLLSKRSPVLSVVTALSLLGVTLGVALVIVALAVLGGFEEDLRRKIIGAHSQVLLLQHGGRAHEPPPDLMAKVTSVPGVVAATPYLEAEVLVSSKTNYGGALLHGVHPDQAAAVITALAPPLYMGNMDKLVAPAVAPQDDDAEFAAPAPLPRLVIGSEMQRNLDLRVGDRVRLISPTLETITPVGPVPASQGFVVGGVFHSGMYEYDARYAYAHHRVVEEFLRRPGQITAVAVNGDDADAAEALAARLSVPGYEALDWQSRDASLFAALKLERALAFVALVFVILVASFSVVNTLTMAAIEKQADIAILKTMGATDTGVTTVFLLQGLFVGGLGTLVGALLGAGTVTYLQRAGFWIPDEAYYIDSLPVNLDPRDLLLIVMSALCILWDFSVYAALRGARLRPVDGLRAA
jgi:lipoprotein-releasing system permease protein